MTEQESLMMSMKAIIGGMREWWNIWLLVKRWGEDGVTKHLQIYVQLKGRMYFNRIKSPFTRDAHIEKQHARQNIDAANDRKKGEWKEWGKMIYWKNFNHALHVRPFCSSLTHSLRILKSKVDGCLTVLKQSSLPLNQHPMTRSQC